MLLKASQVPDSVGLSGDLSVRGKIIRVFDKKSGSTVKYGPWSFQNFVVQDETGEMMVCLKNRKEELSKDNDVGKEVSIVAKETKNGVLGVKVEKEEYKDDKGVDQSIIKVIITGSALFSFEDGSQAEVNPNPTQTTNPVEKAVQGHPTAAPSVDLDSLRADSIKITFEAWKEALTPFDLYLAENRSLLEAVIQAAGRNSDTLFLSKSRSR